MQFQTIFENNKDFNWDFDELSSSENITWKIVENNLHKPWDFKKLSNNKVITWQNIQETPYLQWHWESVTLNLNITLDIIKNNIKYPWDFTILKNTLSENDFESLIQRKEYYENDNYSFESSIENDKNDDIELLNR